MKHLQDLHVLILGLGASGLAMARWCARHGAHVTVADTREAPPQLATLQHDVPAAVFVGGPFSAALVDGTAVRAVYRSPGLSPAAIAPVVGAAKATGLTVGGELDLFALALRDLRTADVPPPVAPVPQPQAEIEMAEQAPVVEAAVETEPQPEVEAEIEPPVALAPSEPEAPPAAPAAANSVHTAARDAAAFVARIAELSAAPVVPVPEDDKPLPIAAPEPLPPEGYTPAVLAITGTNGKTTVTALTGLLVECAGKTVAIAGNIGPTLLDTLAAHLDTDTLPEVWVLELSSFQLDGVQGFEPTAATALNLTQDHLDWHGDMAAYAGAKARVFGEHGLMLLNRDDAGVMAMLPPPVRAKLQRPLIREHVTFGAGMPLRPGDYGIERVNGMSWLVRALEADETQKRKRGAIVQEEIFLQRFLPADALRIRGQHNALNALAALALATAAGCQLAPMLYGLRDYRGEPHRVAPVAIVDAVEYFDDSKGTNVGATVAALGGLGVERRVVVILGGEGKGQDFSPLAAPVAQFARAVVLIGRDAPLIAAALEGTGVSLLNAGTLPEAVSLAAGRAHPGDAVLLSPACASFDMFRDYEHRADVFCEAVLALADAPRVNAGEAA
ncbi:UDP-N-acetylmuramoyl-L-alanine--D-glutamate ligase [Variovorax sp. PAMC 28711]|uniref:UDP-N-acetylmuramoyl-L-alanine--D-glutamate ligase n=1 Tax=Variovorax sp. PAMC 28711 TaxID=1795631 RepID=UPI00078DFC77|nr:UDP-N-acetylmuramoyl-L-alanine--D-glutamate ligase [Variovorax sp. PAMC 28711]AMM24110.1 UDP-N-acetylmuramoylalanine--D-glutamate ligase [Variovorax sp. PAMC 28711]